MAKFDTINTPKLLYTAPTGKEGGKSIRFCNTGQNTAYIYLWLVPKTGGVPPTDIVTQTGDEMLWNFPIPPSGINEPTLWVSDTDKNRIYTASTDLAVSVVVHGAENTILA